MNLLITSVGRRAYMVEYFKEVIGEGKIHAANSVRSYATSIADYEVITPMIYSGDYISFLIDYCLENNINAVISLFDIDLPILSKNKSSFDENNIKLIISDYELIKICNDKWLTFKFLQSNGFKTPQTLININSVRKALKEDLSFPLYIKPRWGMGSIGVYQVDNLEELNFFYYKVKRIIENSYLKFESNLDIEKSIVIQQKAVGIEHGLDVFNDLNGNYLTSVPKIKLDMRAGETDRAKIITSSPLQNIGEKLSLITKHKANLDVDCFVDKNNEIQILEMNCRFGGQYPFSHLAGVNFPKVIVDQINGNDISKNDLKYKAEIVGVKNIQPVELK